MTDAVFDKRTSQPNAVLVVMQTEGIDEYGQVWSFCVWQLTVFHPSEKVIDQTIRKGITPKST